METIGLNFNDMVTLQASVWTEGRKTINTDSSFAQHLERGCSEDEAKFRAEITAQVASITTALLKVMEANNNRILSDLKEAKVFDR